MMGQRMRSPSRVLHPSSSTIRCNILIVFKVLFLGGLWFRMSSQWRSPLGIPFENLQKPKSTKKHILFFNAIIVSHSSIISFECCYVLMFQQFSSWEYSKWISVNHPITCFRCPYKLSFSIIPGIKLHSIFAWACGLGLRLFENKSVGLQASNVSSHLAWYVVE